MSKNRKERRKNNPVDVNFQEMFDELEQKTIAMNDDDNDDDEIDVESTELSTKKVGKLDMLWNKLPKPVQTTAKVVGLVTVGAIGVGAVVLVGGVIAGAFKKDEPEDGSENGTTNTETYEDVTVTEF